MLQSSNERWYVLFRRCSKWHSYLFLCHRLDFTLSYSSVLIRQQTGLLHKPFDVNKHPLQTGLFITCTIEFIFWTTSWQSPPGPPRIWTSPLLSISLPLIKTIFDTMLRIKWRNVFAKIVACMVILRSTVNHVSNVFSIVIVIVSTFMSVIMPTLPVFNIL
mgnify:CR=1 FL=1